jgi:hypothetical protein
MVEGSFRTPEGELTQEDEGGKLTRGGAAERDQECGKSELNGAVLDRSAFNPWLFVARLCCYVERRCRVAVAGC